MEENLEDLDTIGTELLSVRDLWVMAGQAQELFGPHARLVWRPGLARVQYSVSGEDGTALGLITLDHKWRVSLLG